MKSYIKKLKRKFPVNNFFSYRSYSQEGEDMVYRSFYENRSKYKGFYIDVGAHHPFRFSNTLHFYQKGWKGINIEPTPNSLKLFKIFRKRDINLNIGVSEEEGSFPFYCFNEPALNSFSQNFSEQRMANGKYHLTKIIPIKTLPLSSILDTYLPPGQTIDFLTIDAEAFDVKVLKSNNWDKYVPLFIMVEASDLAIERITENDVYQYLTHQNYKLVAKTLRTLFFKLN